MAERCSGNEGELGFLRHEYRGIFSVCLQASDAFIGPAFSLSSLYDQGGKGQSAQTFISAGGEYAFQVLQIGVLASGCLLNAVAGLIQRVEM